MRLNGSIENREEFDNLMADSALAAIDQDAPLMQIETALRSLGETMAKADPLRRAIVREEAIRRLRAAGVRSPTKSRGPQWSGRSAPPYRQYHGGGAVSYD